MDPLRPFTEHPATVGETYTEHLVMAVCFGARLMFAGCACVVHGFFPFLFVRTGSSTVAQLNDRMLAKRRRPAAVVGAETRLPL